MEISVQVEAAPGAPAPVEFRWDLDTAILTAHLAGPVDGKGMSGSVELAGNDGSWLILDMHGGAIRGVEIAVWPDVQKHTGLHAPREVEVARITVPARKAQPGETVLQFDTTLSAEANPDETVFHFRMGGHQAVRTVRIARDVLIDLDDREVLAGLWLLNVPPFPADE